MDPRSHTPSDSVQGIIIHSVARPSLRPGLEVARTRLEMWSRTAHAADRGEPLCYHNQIQMTGRAKRKTFVITRSTARRESLITQSLVQILRNLWQRRPLCDPNLKVASTKSDHDIRFGMHVLAPRAATSFHRCAV